MSSISKTIEVLLRTEARQATKYLEPKLIVRATRKAYGGKLSKRLPIEIILNIGKPNYAEREFVKLCQKSGEKFPVKKIQLKHFKK